MEKLSEGGVDFQNTQLTGDDSIRLIRLFVDVIRAEDGWCFQNGLTNECHRFICHHLHVLGRWCDCNWGRGLWISVTDIGNTWLSDSLIGKVCLFSTSFSSDLQIRMVLDNGLLLIRYVMSSVMVRSTPYHGSINPSEGVADALSGDLGPYGTRIHLSFGKRPSLRFNLNDDLSILDMRWWRQQGPVMSFFQRSMWCSSTIRPRLFCMTSWRHREGSCWVLCSWRI